MLTSCGSKPLAMGKRARRDFVLGQQESLDILLLVKSFIKFCRDGFESSRVVKVATANG